MNEGEESGGEFVKAGSDAPILLEFLKEALDEVAFLVEMPVARPRLLVRLGRDAVIRARRSNEASDCLGTVGFICQHHRSLQRHGRQGCFRFPGIVEVARRQVDMDRIPQPIDDRVDFRRPSAPADSDVLLDFPAYRPFFAPALC